MHAFIIVSKNSDARDKEVIKVLSPFAVNPVDITRIVPQNTIGIEELRLLKQRIALKPYKSKTKAIIIEEAQTLTIEAQNAFLKTLEEPPDHTIIILLTSNVDALLPTIVSRCQVIQLPTINQQLTTEKLEAKSKELAAFLQGGIGERFVLAERVTKDKQTAIDWLSDMILITRHLLIERINNYTTEDIPIYLQLLKSSQRAYTLLSTTNVNPRFTLETLFLSLP